MNWGSLDEETKGILVGSSTIFAGSLLIDIAVGYLSRPWWGVFCGGIELIILGLIVAVGSVQDE